MDNASYTKIDQATNGLPLSPHAHQERGSRSDVAPGAADPGSQTAGTPAPPIHRPSCRTGVNREPRPSRDSELDEEAVARMEDEGGGVVVPTLREPPRRSLWSRIRRWAQGGAV